MPVCVMQTHNKDLQQVLDVVVSHQALELKCELVVRLLYALAAPRAEHFRPLLRRLAGLVGEILHTLLIVNVIEGLESLMRFQHSCLCVPTRGETQHQSH